MTASEALIHGVETTFWVSLLTVLVLMLRRPVTRRFGSRAAMLLWLAPALRLVVPAFPREVRVAAAPPSSASIPVEMTGTVMPPVSVAVQPTNDAASPVVMPEGTVLEVAALPPAMPGTVSDAGLAAGMPSPEMLAAFVLCLWFLGFMVTAGLCALRARRWQETLLAEAVPVPEVVRTQAAEAAGRAGTDKCFTLIMSDAASTPQIMGLRKPLLALPTDFQERYRPDEQEMVLLHELTHLKRGDLGTLLVSEIGFALQWFNPLTRQAREALRADQEAACDEAVRALGINTKDYAALLLKAARKGRSLPALTLDHGLKERIVRMQNPLGTPMKRTVFALLAGASAIALAGFTASRTEVTVYEHPENEHQEREAEAEDKLLEGLSPRLRAAIEAERAEQARARERSAARGDDAEREARIARALDILLSESGIDAEAEAADMAVERAVRILRMHSDGGPKDVRILRRSEAHEHGADVSANVTIRHRGLKSDEMPEGLRREEHVLIGPDGKEKRIIVELSEESNIDIIADGDRHKIVIDGVETDLGERGDEDGVRRVLRFFDRSGEGKAFGEWRTNDRGTTFDFDVDSDFQFPDGAEIARKLTSAIAPHHPHRVRIEKGQYEDGMVLLNDPFASLDMPDLDPPKPPAFEFEAPKVTKKTTDEGTWILIPEEPDMSGFEAAMEAFEVQMEAFGERMEEWGDKMEEIGDAIEDLADACEDHREESGEPAILVERVSSMDQEVRAVCASGGPDRFESDRMIAFLKEKDLSKEEWAVFKENLQNR